MASGFRDAQVSSRAEAHYFFFVKDLDISSFFVNRLLLDTSSVPFLAPVSQCFDLSIATPQQQNDLKTSDPHFCRKRRGRSGGTRFLLYFFRAPVKLVMSVTGWLTCCDTRSIRNRLLSGVTL